MKLFFNILKFRLLGYYHSYGQDMKPELVRVKEANDLARLLDASVGSLMKNPNTDNELKEIIKDGAVFIFKDEKNNLYGFFTKNRTARITDVKFSKRDIIQVPLKYKAWFYPGRPIKLIIPKEESHQEEPSTTPMNNSNNNKMESKTKIPAPEVNVKALESVFDKMYITNVEKRLRELNSPSDNDRKRWVWELIQNAKDTIAKDSNRDSIDVRIEVEGDIVRFRHNGEPFTPEARLGLLYKYSEDKENQESTGRFGTGFLTTHCLSKVVNIESNMYSDSACTKLCGFSVTMYRDGLIASELIEGLKKMRESEAFYNETFEWTTFTYHVSSESGREAIKLGIENFRENIAQTMLFCKELSRVVLDDNGKITTIERKPTIHLMDDIKLSEFVISGETSLTRRFIHTSYLDYNEELSKRYRATRNLRIDAAVEVDSENNLVDIKDKTTFFCVMPLVGIETQLNEPLIINSPDFEPDQERQSLLLSGLTWNEEKDVITETGINQRIYEHIFPLYDKLVNFLTNKHYGKMYFLANGLDRTKSHEKLDKDWYKQNVICKYREILGNYSVADAQDNSGYKKLGECIIVKEPVRENEDKLYNLLQSLYPSKLVKDNHEWSDHLWKDGLAVWNTELLCAEVEKESNWNKLNLTNSSLSVWYNDFLKHVSNYNELLLKDHALLPNMNGELLKKDTKEFKQGEHVTSFVIGLLGKLGKDVKPILLHNDITAICLESKYTSQSFSADINKLAKSIIDNSYIGSKLQQLLPLLSVIPSDSDKYKSEFLKQRKDFFEIAKSLFMLSDAVPTTDNNLLDSSWKELDIWFVTYVLQSLKSKGALSELPTGLDAKWLNNALQSLKVEINRLNVYEILPNQNGKFCKQNALYEDVCIPEELKDDVFASISLKYKNILLHKDIDAATFSVTQKKTISDFANDLKRKVEPSSNSYSGNFFNGAYHHYSQTAIETVSLYVLSLLPQNKESEVYLWQEKLLKTARELLIDFEIPVDSYINYETQDLWQGINLIIVGLLCNKIKTAGKVEALILELNGCGESHLFELLNSFYDFLKHANISYSAPIIFPNQKGVFCKISDLKKEEGTIDDILKNIISRIVPDSEDYRHLLMDKRCSIQPQAELTLDTSYALIDLKMHELYENPNKWSEESFIEAAQLLIEDWGDNHGGIFKDKFPRTFPDKEKILMNVVWKKEKRELLMSVSTRLSEEQLRIIIDNSTEIGDLSAKVKDLEAENDLLKQKLAKYENQQNGLINSIHTFAQDELNLQFGHVIERDGLSQEEQIAAHKEAERIIKEKLESDGYDCSNWVIEDDNSSYKKWKSVNQVDNIISPNGESINLVIKSAKGGYIYLSATDFEFLTSNSNNVLMVWDGGNVHSVTAEDIFNKDSNVNLIFDTDYTPKHYYAALSKVFQYVKRTTFAVKNPNYNAFDTIKPFGVDSTTEGVQELFDDDNL